MFERQGIDWLMVGGLIKEHNIQTICSQPEESFVDLEDWFLKNNYNQKKIKSYLILFWLLFDLWL